MPPLVLAVVILVFIAASVFDITNGMNDVSGMLAAPVTTGTLRAPAARLVVLLGIFCGPFLAPAAVARAYATGLVSLPSAPGSNYAALAVLGCALTGAALWNLLARARGWPTSSSHALVGALIGAAVAAVPRLHTIHWGVSALEQQHQLAGFTKILIALFLSPLLGSLAGWAICRFLHAALRRAHRKITIGLRFLQGITLLIQGISYGMNDAQKTMGLLTAAVILCEAAGPASLRQHGIGGVPEWIRLISVANITIGALVGSRAILRKLGEGVFNLRVVEAVSAQVAAAGVVFAASRLGGPVSSGQVLSSAIVGAGSASRGRAVRWSTAGSILQSWFITIPGAAIIGAVLMGIARLAVG